MTPIDMFPDAQECEHPSSQQRGLGYRWCFACRQHFTPVYVDRTKEAKAYLVAIRPKRGGK